MKLPKLPPTRKDPANVATDRAIILCRVSLSLNRAWQDAAACSENAFGDSGPLISGVIRDHFPEDVKDALRELARRATYYSGQSLTVWRSAGRTLATWRVMRDRLQR